MAGEAGYGQAGQFNQLAMSAMAANSQMGILTRTILGTGIALQAMGSAVGTFASLQQTITLTGAVASGTSKELSDMTKKARDFAVATKFSANEAASAMYFLASAGMSVRQSMSAMNGVLLLSQATLSDTSVVADTVASSIQAFGMAAGSAMRVSNLFSASINASQATIEKLAFSMRQVSPVAASFGLNIEDTVTALSTLYNVGLRGEQAGTALRNVLVRLNNPTTIAKDALTQMGIATQDAEGKMRNLQAVLQDFQRVNPDMSTLKTIFEDEALPGIQALIAATKEYNREQMKAVDPERLAKITELENSRGMRPGTIKNDLELMRTAVSGTNSAVEVAMKQMVTLAGTMATGRNAVNDLGIAMGETLAPAIKTIANAVIDATLAWREMNSGVRGALTTIPLLVAGYMVLTRAQAAFAAASRTSATFGRTLQTSAISGRNTELPFFQSEAERARRNQRVMYQNGPNGPERIRVGSGQYVSPGGAYAIAGGGGYVPASTVTTAQMYNHPQYGPVNAVQNNAGRWRIATGQPGGGQFIPSAAQINTQSWGWAGGQRYNVTGSTASGVMHPNSAGVLQQGRAVTERFTRDDSGALVRQSGFGRAMGMAGNALGIIGTVAIAYESIQLLATVLSKWNAPDKTVPGINIGGDATQQMRSMLLLGGGDAEQVDRLKSVMKVMDEQVEEMGKMRERYQNLLSQRMQEVGQLAQSVGGVDINAIGDQSVRDALLNALTTNSGYALSSGRNQKEDTAAYQIFNKLMTNKEFQNAMKARNIQGDARGIQVDLAQITENLSEVDGARALGNMRINERTSRPGYALSREMTDKQAALTKTMARSDYTYINHETLREFQRSRREQENIVNQLRAALSNNPFDQFIAELEKDRDAQFNKLDQVAKNFAQKIDNQFGNKLGGFTGLSQIITGQSFMESMVEWEQKTDETGSVTSKAIMKPTGRIKKGALEMLEQGGYSPEEIMAAYVDAVSELRSRLSGYNDQAQVKKEIEAYIEQFQKTIMGGLETIGLEQRRALIDRTAKLFSVQSFMDGLTTAMRGDRVNSLQTMANAGDQFMPASIQAEIERNAEGRRQEFLALAQLEQSFFANWGDKTGAPQNIQDDWKKYTAERERAIDAHYKEAEQNIIQSSRKRRQEFMQQIAAEIRDVKADALDVQRQMGMLTLNPSDIMATLPLEGMRGFNAAMDKAASLARRADDLQQMLNRGNGYVPGLGTSPMSPAALGPTGSYNQIRAMQESGNRMVPNAMGSGAYGIFQFMPQTWAGIAKNNPQLGLPADVRQSTDAQQRAAKEIYDRQNSVNLGITLGRSATPTDMAMSERFGVAGTKALYDLGPSVKFDQIAENFWKNLGEAFTNSKLLEQNPDLKGKTIGDIHQFYARTVGTGEGGMTATAMNLFNKGNNPWGAQSNVQQDPAIAAKMRELLPLIQEQARAYQELANEQIKHADIEGMVLSNRRARFGEFLDMYYQSNREVGTFWQGIQLGFAQMIQKQDTMMDTAMKSTTMLSEGLLDIGAGFVVGLENQVGQSMTRLLQNVAFTLAKAAMMKAAMGLASNLLPSSWLSFLGMGGSSLPAAGAGSIVTSVLPVIPGAVFNGGVFSNGVRQFSAGGIVNSNQYFPMANGGTVGSISERGAQEAVMPIVRGSGGRLGVLAAGGGGGGSFNYSPTINVNGGGGTGAGGGFDPRQAEAMGRMLDREVKATVEKVMQQQRAPGGLLNGSSNKYGQVV